jgi:hypothetical protein
MKKIVLVLLMIAAIVGSAAADVDFKAYPESVEKGDILVNAGIGFGTPLAGDMVIPPIQASVDYAFLSPFTLGGLFGFTTSKIEWSATLPFIGDYGYTTNYTGLVFGARFGYHPNLGVKNLDVAANALLGYYYLNRATEYHGDYYLSNPKPDPKGDSELLFGVNVDVRYFFTKNIGIFGEFGYSKFAFATAGVALKF